MTLLIRPHTTIGALKCLAVVLGCALAGQPCLQGDSPPRTSAEANPHLFQGARNDAETGFYYARNRYYNPGTGRFLQRDPVWDKVNVGNAYTFVGSNPISSVDPLGLTESVVCLPRKSASEPSLPELSPTEWGLLDYAGMQFFNMEKAYRQLGQENLAVGARQAANRIADLSFRRAQAIQGSVQDMVQESKQAKAWGEGSTGYELARQAAHHEQRRREIMQGLGIMQKTISALGPSAVRAAPGGGYQAPRHHRPALGNPSIRNFRAYEKASVANRMRTSLANDVARQRGEWMRAVRDLECQNVFTRQEADWIYRNIDTYIEASLNRQIYLSNFGRQLLRPHPDLGIPRGIDPGQGTVHVDPTTESAIRLDDPPTTGTGTEIIQR